MPNKEKKAVVLVSGGLDSSTVLAMAISQAYQCYALSVDYGQKHRFELQKAADLAKQLGAIEHKIIQVEMGVFGGSALTDTEIDVPKASDNQAIPITYVPARNTVFLSLALAWAEVLQANSIFIGANAVDYSGYPDCRAAYIQAFQAMANLATKQAVEGDCIEIKAPIISMSKAQIIQKGLQLGVDYGKTLSCYNPNQHGAPCHDCDACHIRAQGFAQAGAIDPSI